MTVLVAVVAVGLVGGVVGFSAAVSWPARDPTAPRLTRRQARSLILGHRHVAAVLHRHTDPAATSLAILAAASTVVIVTVAIAGILLILATTDPVTGRTDGPLAQWAADNIEPSATAVIGQISRLGGTDGVVLSALAVTIFEWRRLPVRNLAVFLVLVIGGQFAIVNLAKVIIDRARPDVLQLTGFASTSFPSGHAAAAAASFAAYAMVLGRGRSRRAQAALAGCAGGVAFAVAATRVALGVHWFTDVIAGMVVGWGWFVLCAVVMGGPALHLGRAVELAQEVEAREFGDRSPRGP